MWLLNKVTYAGPLTLVLVHLAVYGINFSIEPNLTDLQVAERVRSQLKLSLSSP